MGSLDIWNNHLQLGFPINIALVRWGWLLALHCSYLIGGLILNPLLWLVDWQQRRVSVAPLPLVSWVLISSWIRLDRIPVGGQGKQKPLPVIPISNNVYLVYNGPTPIQVSLMKYRWYSYCNHYGVHMVYLTVKHALMCQKRMIVEGLRFCPDNKIQLFFFWKVLQIPERSFYWAPSPTLGCSLSWNSESTPPLTATGWQRHKA